MTLTIAGPPRPIGDHVDSSAYRIVQEALTNVLRHAGGATAQVTVTYRPEVICLDVVDDGPQRHAAGRRGPRSHRHARARRRVRRHLTAAPRPDGGFAVHATLPS